MSVNFPSVVEKWDVFEVSLTGRTDGNPYTDHSITAVFEGAEERVETDGFYDSSGIYRVRFMPSHEGSYTFTVSGSFTDAPVSGSFSVTAPSAHNHGPVHVKDRFHFAYDDGTPYYSVGTTCYVWELQSDERIAETLQSLETAGFNKIRFCIFPKHYDYNLREPRSYPYEGTPMDSSVLTRDNFNDYTFKTEGNHWDFTRFNPEHFRHIEKCILELRKRGIEADLIMMHPYDRWGFSSMTREQDALYWRYAVARFAAYRNVWWSLANEWDLMPSKTEADWEMYGDILVRHDPYGHPRSIHNCHTHYDHTRGWVTHCSIQRTDIYKGAEEVNQWRERYGKPVVMDEIAYEGNIQHGWGNITGEEMLRRFWECAVRGGYPGHGETYMNENDVLWWSHGGRLHGESWKRVNFLRYILGQTPGLGLKPYVKKDFWDCVCAVPENDALAESTGYRLYYFSFMRPSFREFYFDDTTPYCVEVIDTWNTTLEPVGTFTGKFKVPLPGRQYMAIRIRKA